MKNLTKNLFFGLFLLAATASFGQGKIKGKVVANDNSAIPGANVVIKGSQTGTATDVDGKFTLKATTASGSITVSSVGYQSKTISFTTKTAETVDLGTIKLAAIASDLQEVVVKSNIVDVAKDRKTPVAVSTIKAAEIQQKLGNQEFPMALKSTPSVYVSNQGGGFGDSRITIRGFSQTNIAVMINGVPVNDMENGAVFWSNWAGLSDVTSAMQVQRGLGSSKLAIPSVGGTINVMTKSSDLPEGGSVMTSVGNNNYLKTQASYNTGLMSNGLSASILFSTTSGEGYVDGTHFDGRNYYVALGYKKGNHDLQFTMTGAPQWHDQRSTAFSIATAQKYGSFDEPNRQYNSDWGMLGNEEMNMRRNYYHKPVMSINWDWKINDKMKLSTVVYGSWGRGAGSNGAGVIKGFNYTNAAFRKLDGTIDFNKIQAYNSGIPTMINGVLSTRTQVGGQFENSLSTANNTTNGLSRISSFNSHNWYGGIIDLNTKLTDNLTLDFGVDARTYKGIHFQNVNNMFGGTLFNAAYNTPAGTFNNNINQPVYYVNETYSVTPSNNPFASANVDQKIGYDYDGNVNWYGAFTQLEYSKNNLTAYIQGAVSQQGFSKTDRFTYLLSNPLSNTGYENIKGYNVKGGANYNITANHNVFFNAGYYSKQPFFNVVYPNNRSLVNGNLTNEKILGFEAGYGFTASKINAKINVYRTEWKDRYQRATDNINVGTPPAPENPGGYFDFSGITEIHSGVELELSAKPLDKLKVNAMVSVGDWQYKGNSISNRYDVSNNPFTGGTGSVQTLYLDGAKVGNSAQTTASVGAAYEVLRNVNLDANYNYFDKLYANINPANFNLSTNKGSLLLPSYGLFDAGFSYKLMVGKDKSNSVNFRCNVNNLFDKIYIAESSSNQFTANEDEFNNPVVGVNSPGLINPAGAVTTANKLKGTGAGQYSTYADYQSRGVYNGTDIRNNVWFGFGRTWNFGITYKF